ncbi:MATE family efflux transporter [Bacillus sp. V3B]|uniref:MATE family efflux transporter n=1 Tax=Bacillus sp. V3B TaxID=2804915 RepID=UPI0021087281|nr:MATE family efflux transporter [Bacillus sp. V3B]MCQ6276607.1 MATE family efflux transporter [Bacillus sp. V3B]
MIQTDSKKAKLHQLMVILIPILITQVGMYSMNFFDTMMSGHYSAKDLAGVAIGSSLWVPISTGLTGILIAITPIVAQLIGANKEKEVSLSVIQGVYVAMMMTFLILLIGSFVLNPILNGMELEQGVHKVAHDYLIAISFGVFPLFIYNALRSFIDALGKTRISMLIILSALPINAFLNYLFIYGKAGFPELGGVGTGYATALTYWILLLFSIVIVYKQKTFSHYQIFRGLRFVSLKKMGEILLVGIPIGLSIFFETSIFSAVTLFMSEFDTITIASHQIAMNFSSLLYMIPLSISMALTILVGFEIGAKRYHDAKQYSWLGVIVAVIMAIFSGLIILFLRTEVASMYSKDPLVIELSIQFLLYALFFQLSDAFQAPIQGSLRGYKDVNVTFIMSLLSYWVIGLPLGYVLAKFTHLGPFGYWIGLIAGLAVGAICLSSRLLYIQKKIDKHNTDKFLNKTAS